MAERTLDQSGNASELHPLALGWRAWIDYESVDILGCLSEAPTFNFRKADGTFRTYTAEEMRADPWWESLPEQAVQMIEARIYPLPEPEHYVHYVARHKNGALVPRSLLSDFFEGPDASARAQERAGALQATWPDAAVFLVRSVEDGKQLLDSDDPAELSRGWTDLRMREARYARMKARSN